MESRDAVLYHDFNLAAHAGHSPDYETYLVLLDEESPASYRQMMERSSPFCAVPDYLQPPGAKG
jgi:hypothetical protein